MGVLFGFIYAAMGFASLGIIVFGIEFHDFLMSGEWAKIQCLQIYFWLTNEEIFWYDFLNDYKIGIKKIIIWILEMRLGFLCFSLAGVSMLISSISRLFTDNR